MMSLKCRWGSLRRSLKASGATTGLSATLWRCTAARAWPSTTQRRHGASTITSSGATWVTWLSPRCVTSTKLWGVVLCQMQMVHPHHLTKMPQHRKTLAASSSHTSTLMLQRAWGTTCVWRMLRPSKRNKATGVLPATFSSSGAMSQRTHDSSASTGSTMRRAIHVTTCG